LEFELRTRLLLSCLVDADRLDAEAWAYPNLAEVRERALPLDPAAGLAALGLALDAVRTSSAGADHVRAIRDEVMAAALAAATQPPGFFSLTVPTGGGKTLASLAFALEHARAHGLRRIIFVLPYLAIIEQNVDVIRTALGDRDGRLGLVLEHHSNVTEEVPLPGTWRETGEPDAEVGQDLHAIRRRLVAENWDAPVIVTTTVQFFESLFAAHPSRVRKLHNIPRSVIVFDEAQTFPPGMLRPLLGMLSQLKDSYRCSFLFCTATQPALEGPVGAGTSREVLLAEGEVREIVPDPRRLFSVLNRVDVEWPTAGSTTSMADIAAEMAASGTALAILNTKAQARALYRSLHDHDTSALHLSSRMCAAHRRTTVAEVKQRLAAGLPCLLAATQVVEAGVDLDFPAVWRAFAPLDGIAQASGRCNREGRLPGKGRLVVFHPEDDAVPSGVYKLGTDIARALLAAAGSIDLADPAIYREYFQRLYGNTAIDEGNVVDSRRKLNFPAVASAFRIIDEDTRPVVVPWGEGRRLMGRIRLGEPLTPADVRRLQPYTVSLHTNEVTIAAKEGLIEEQDGVLLFRGDYDERLGLVLPGGYAEG
jgi:CRISPR-associated endonuclease/helicase Cas3